MVHIFVLIIPHNRTVSAWEPISQGRQKAGRRLCGPSQVAGGGFGPRVSHAQGPLPW